MGHQQKLGKYLILNPTSAILNDSISALLQRGEKYKHLKLS
jgi:hypothetical protein